MDVEKNEGRLFRRPKLTLSYSAEGKDLLKARTVEAEKQPLLDNSRTQQ
jgi:hypothetical protein